MAQERARYQHTMSVLFTRRQLDALRRRATKEARTASAHVRKLVIDDLVAAGLYDEDADPALSDEPVEDDRDGP